MTIASSANTPGSVAQWHSAVIAVFDDWRNSGSKDLVISPDVDGLATSCLLAKHYESKIIGIYTGQHLLLADGYRLSDARDALWLDHDVNGQGVRCVGQHLVHHAPSDNLPTRHAVSWNPNVWQRQAWSKSFAGIAGKKQDKYPYATAHFVASALGDLETTDPNLLSLLAHADGAWFALDIYKANAAIWESLMFGSSNTIGLMRRWASASNMHAAHKSLVDLLTQNGIKQQVSRSKRAALLTPNLKALTGNQSVKGRPTKNPQQYWDNLRAALSVVEGVVGFGPTIPAQAGIMVSGERQSHYPNRVVDDYGSFDAMLAAEAIFSHAFTDQRTLQFTKSFGL